ncbi:MAG: peptidoglycan DD-metalloendopeptidase family protein [Actinobacteria bacterium]|nr:peptidoglycan DD-metalloendopeptidase family protein [Actinomycetota bacterium]
MKSPSKQRTQLKARYIIAILIALAIFISFNSLTYLTPRSSLYSENLEEELDKVKNQKEQTQKEIEEAKKAEASYIKQVNQVEGNLIKALAELDDLSAKLADKKREVDKITIELVIKGKELADLEKELTEKISLLNGRMAEIYKKKNYNLIELLFETDSFIRLFSKFKLMNLLAKQDLEIMQDIKFKRDSTINIKENIAELKSKEKSEKEKIEKLVSDAEQKKKEVEGIYTEKKSLLSQTRANKNALIAMEKQLEAKEAEITKKLEALRYGNAPGKLTFPTKGILTSGFGNRISPISGTMRFHAGIDIGCNSGTPVVAAASGEVVQAGYMGGYGYAVIIYHGGGFSTVYGHLSKFAVSTGQKVQRNQIIGYVGSTGYATGPHLHFEVRINGVLQNPLNFF